MYTGTHLFKIGVEVPSFIGLALISEGGLAIAIIINFRILYPMIGDSLITIIIISIFLSELLSPRLIIRQLAAESESVNEKNPSIRNRVQKEK